MEIFGIGDQVKTLDDIREKAPAVFTRGYHPDRTDRYSFLPTDEILNSMTKLGWEPTYAKQSHKGKFDRHLIRLENPKLKGMVNIDGLTPQTIIDNSHNGYSPASIHMGLFRLVCTNGMVISVPGMFDQYKFRHVGINQQELELSIEKIISNYDIMAPRLKLMMDRDMKAEEKEAFAIDAIASREPWRFMEGKEILTDKVLELNNIDKLLAPKRGADQGEDLWKVFNVIQEKLVNGGYERLSDKGRKSTSRAIGDPAREIRFNKDLWEMAESYL